MPVCVENADDIAKGSVIGGGGGFGFGAGFCGSTTACLGTKAVEKSGVSNWTRVEIAGPAWLNFVLLLCWTLRARCLAFMASCRFSRRSESFDRRHCAIARSWPRRDPDA